MTGRTALLCFALISCARPVAAQGVSLAPSDPTRWDAGVTIGWLGGDKEDIAEPWNDWYDTFAASVDVGRYWTPHLKTEAGVTMTSGGTVYSQHQVLVPGRPAPTFFTREHRFSIRALDLAASYQFLENAWAHPFLAAGLQLGWERERFENWPHTNVPVPLPQAAPRTRHDARPFVSGGAKFYVNERGFIRTDLSAALDRRGATRVWWRIGGGVDF